MIVLIARYQVQPGQTETVLAYLRQMADQVRDNEPDCSLYQVCRAHDDPDTLLLVEHYQDQAAVDLHRNTLHFQKYVINSVIPLLVSREVAFYELVIA